jgi:kynureninase
MMAPRQGETLIRHEDIIEKIKEGDFALIMLPGVQYATGQYFDMKAITDAGHENARSSDISIAYQLFRFC